MSATTAELLQRGDQPEPGEHVVMYLTGTATGTRVTVDTPEGRAHWTIERAVGWYHATDFDTGDTKTAGNFGALLGRILRDARGDD